MALFVLALVLFGLLIVGGIVLNLYLYSNGVVGRRYAMRLQGLQSATAYSMAEEAAIENEFYSHIGADIDESARYARRGLLVMLGVASTAVFVVSAMVSVLLH